jgi:hypothetical protein
VNVALILLERVAQQDRDQILVMQILLSAEIIHSGSIKVEMVQHLALTAVRVMVELVVQRLL